MREMTDNDRPNVFEAEQGDRVRFPLEDGRYIEVVWNRKFVPGGPETERLLVVEQGRELVITLSEGELVVAPQYANNIQIGVAE